MASGGNRFQECTPRQKEFCEYYISNGFNGTQAYMKAFDTKDKDSASKCANKLKRMTKIQKYLAKIQEELLTGIHMTNELFLEKQMAVYEFCMIPKSRKIFDQRTGVFIDSKEMYIDSKGANDALANIARMTGLNKDKIDVRQSTVLTELVKDVFKNEDDT